MAHDTTKKWRSEDIKIEENLEFSSLLLSKKVLTGLNTSGFIKPSPIQLQAIPLGRCGLDLIVQAKSGTGKTCVFAVIALEGLLMDSKATQVLVLAPTREIAYQIKEVITTIGSAFPNLKCGTFIGGLSLNDDKNNLKNCQIAIGTPGRIKHLIELGVLKTNSIRLFVLDEADRLLDPSFIDSINWIYKKLPQNKQMLALSATYPEELANLLKEYMRNPFFVRLNADQPALIGIKQFYKVTPFHQLSHVAFQKKIDELLELLKQIHFSQCLVFTNAQTRAESLCETLMKNGWPAAYISGAQEQTKRLSAISQLKDFQCRILVSTDLTSRGIDAENVNLVINMDVPRNLETYLHRIGRAGRFGSQGLSISLVSKGKDCEDLRDIAFKGRLDISLLPRTLPDDLWSYIGESAQSLTEDLENNLASLKNESEPKTLSLHVPNPNLIRLSECDFDWLNEDESVETFPTVNEIMHDFETFTLSSKNMKEDIDTESKTNSNSEQFPKYHTSKEKCLNYLKENKRNFWEAALKNYIRNDLNEQSSNVMSENNQLRINCDESSKLNVTETSSAVTMDNNTKKTNVLNLDDQSCDIIDRNNQSSELSVTAATMDNNTNKSFAHKINPAPILLNNITVSKRRLLEFYQGNKTNSKHESENPLNIQNPRRELRQIDAKEPIDCENSTAESSHIISEEECAFSSESICSNSSITSTSTSETEDSSSEDDYQAQSSKLQNCLYRFPNMTNYSMQRAYYNQDAYTKQMMEWNKQRKE